jgi:hypothetical protein
MSELTDKRKIAVAYERELQDTAISRPEWLPDVADPASSETVPNAIPKDLLDAILDVIAYSIQQLLAEVLARCVTEAVERATRPLAEEVALMRIAIENDWRSEVRRERGHYARKSEDDKE